MSQGSVLGPLLFLVYINDTVISSEIAKFIMFADDTNLFFKHKNLHTLYTIINDELSKISAWFKLNKLSLHIKKTNYIIFQSSTKNPLNDSNFDICIDGIKIEKALKTKFLRVNINYKLDWSDHIHTVCNKISKNFLKSVIICQVKLFLGYIILLSSHI